jgi:hypothetical protein
MAAVGSLYLWYSSVATLYRNHNTPLLHACVAVPTWGRRFTTSGVVLTTTSVLTFRTPHLVPQNSYFGGFFLGDDVVSVV